MTIFAEATEQLFREKDIAVKDKGIYLIPHAQETSEKNVLIETICEEAVLYP